MKPMKPSVKIPGDSQDEIMARSGELVGFSKSRFVWRFGFMPDSDSCKAYGVYTLLFHWVIALKNGRVLNYFSGFACDLPKRYQKIIDKKL